VPSFWTGGRAERWGRRSYGRIRQEFLMNTLRGGNPMNADLVKLPTARPSAEGLSKLESTYRQSAPSRTANHHSADLPCRRDRARGVGEGICLADRARLAVARAAFAAGGLLQRRSQSGQGGADARCRGPLLRDENETGLADASAAPSCPGCRGGLDGSPATGETTRPDRRTIG
jgi:hypothetical protein